MEPGLNLANLIVAERNSKAAIADARRATQAVAALTTRLERMEKQFIQKEDEIKRLQTRLALLNG